RRAEFKRQRLLKHSNNTISSSQVDRHASARFDSSGCISTFEIGSISRRYDEAKKMSSPLVTSNRGTSLFAKLILHLSSAHNSITIYHLKKVPDCKFCGEFFFEYESPGFSCDNGSIKLISHQMPMELSNLFLGNTEECKHFRTYSLT
ncbi:hypothetical protein H5410_060752, partial [Solanum commersonii]